MLVRVVAGRGPVLSLAMVGGAAGPLGGDRLRFRLELGCGARVALRSVAATMAQPGPRGEPSELRVELVVGADATLDWRPERDDLDAKLEMYVRCLSRDKEPGPFTARDPVLGKSLYKDR